MLSTRPTLFLLWTLAELQRSAFAAPDLMVACYASIPRHVDATAACGSDQGRVLHARQGEASNEQQQRRRLMECGEFCSGWDNRTFCTEFMCDADTTGEVCDTIPATDDHKQVLGLVDKAKAHFIEHATELGNKECVGVMEHLVCVCLDQNMME